MQAFRKQFPQYSQFFSFDEFNEVQLKCYKPLTRQRSNMVVSAPTSSGKTVIFELAIITQIKLSQLKCLYLAPIKSLCHEKSANWHHKFGSKLNIFELTSDTSPEQENNNELDTVNLVIATPQKIDSYSRKSLDFLSKINLLLVDQVHMLNFQQRGATLQAVVSRIISISNPRIIAVSATIPNIKEVAQWLKVSPSMTMVFGQQYRPVKINKVVLGFKSSNNPYTFQKLLNYKLIQVIRTYSEQKGVLVFCQTQKGTQMACQQVISDMRERQFIQSDQTLLGLIQGSKKVSNTTLQIMIPQGVAFHNAGLSMQDRSVVQKLFLENKIRILCTTSTLAMGINLPARLVVIKSTQCYRGAGKGYQQYTQIQMDQMLGRAGRPPFDTSGTVVIMTQKQNYNKYLNSGKLQTLQSHLYSQLSEHINAEISLKSIKNFKDVLRYFMNSFCYIRMKNSPSSYGIKQQIDKYVEKICLESVKKLNTYNLINYYTQNGSIMSRQLGVNVARNSIQIDSIVHIIQQISKIKTERDYFCLLFDSQEIKKQRNKLDQRKLLKQLNENNKYTLKNAISTPQKKYYVLVQAQLDGRHIQNWELRKQAKDVLYFLRRLTYCVKTVCKDLNLFWPFFWSCMLNKYFASKFWQRNQQMVMRQFKEINEKWKVLSNKGFKNIDHIINNLHHLDTMCQKNSQFSQNLCKKIQNIKQSVLIKFSSINSSSHNFNDQQNDRVNEEISQQNWKKGQKDFLITIKFNGFFTTDFKYITVVVGQAYELYTIRTLKQECKQIQIAISSKKSYNIGIIKDNFIGFDQFYQISDGKNVRIIENVADFIDSQSNDKINKAQKDRKQKIQERSNERNQVEDQQTVDSCQKKTQNNIKRNKSSKNSLKKQIKPQIRSKSNQMAQNYGDNNSEQTTISKKAKIIKFKNPNKSNIKSRKKKLQTCQSEDQLKPMKPGTYIPLNQYKCWRPGMRQIQSVQKQKQMPIASKLLIIDEASSKSKSSIDMDNLATIKSKQNIEWTKYAFNHNKINNVPFELKKCPKQETDVTLNMRKEEAKNGNQKMQMKISNPYDYFLNLFQDKRI